MGGQNSVTTNKQQTTNTTDNHNSPSGFFQNPRANNTINQQINMFSALNTYFTTKKALKRKE